MKTAIVIASGPSMRSVCLPLLQAADAVTIAVNNAVLHARFADYVFTLDTVDLNERYDLPWFRGVRVAAVPSDYGAPDARFRCDRVDPMPDVRYIERTDFRAGFDTVGKIMTGCSGFGAYQFAYKFLDADRVFIFGCDHSQQGTYFYGQQRNPAALRNWKIALDNWNRHKPPVETWNVSPVSRISSLPKITPAYAYGMLGLSRVPVVTVLKCGGEYNEGHVEWLQRQIGHPIVCLTDSTRKMKGVVSIPLEHDLPGWWSKLEMFRDDLVLGDFLYADLDTVFLRGVPGWITDLRETHVLSDMYGGKVINSGLMYLRHEDRPAIWLAFAEDKADAIRECGAGGDQAFLDRFWSRKARFQNAAPGKVISYKADVLKNRFHRPENGDLSTADIVCFHGKPRPWQTQEEWIPA